MTDLKKQLSNNGDLVAMILVDYKSLEKTISFILHCEKQIEDSSRLRYIIVENFEVGYAGTVINKIYNLCFEPRYEGEFNLPIYVFKIPHGPKIILYESGTNVGYAKGNNIGAKIAKFYFQCCYYIFSNNDLKIKKMFKLSDIDKQFSENSDIGVIGPKIKDLNNLCQNPCKNIGDFRQLFLYHLNLILGGTIFSKLVNSVDFSEKSKICSWVSGSFYIIREQCFWEVNGFDENTFLFAEEMIMSERLKNIGYYSFFFNEIELKHEHSATIKQEIDQINVLDISFNSLLYFFVNYKKIGRLKVLFYRISFLIFKKIYLFEKKLKNCF